MVLVFQIASGVVLGGIFLWLIFNIFARSPTLERAIGNLLVMSAIFGSVAFGLFSNWVVTLLIVAALVGFLTLSFTMFYVWGLVQKDKRWKNFKKIIPPFLWAPLGVVIWLAVTTFLLN
jgi:hypothetical protein